jgi:hypothetical protein
MDIEVLEDRLPVFYVQEGVRSITIRKAKSSIQIRAALQFALDALDDFDKGGWEAHPLDESQCRGSRGMPSVPLRILDEANAQDVKASLRRQHEACVKANRASEPRILDSSNLEEHFKRRKP